MKKLHFPKRTILAITTMMFLSFSTLAQSNRSYHKQVHNQANDRFSQAIASSNHTVEHGNSSLRRMNRRYRQTVVYRSNIYPIVQNVRTIPRSAIRFRGHREDLYYSCGNFYQSTRLGFRVIPIPLGAQLRQLPPGTHRFIHRGAVLYQFDTVLLEARIARSGEIYYEVIGYA